MYTVDYFIDKFEKIPEENWLENGCFQDGNGRFCALGHCALRPWSRVTSEAVALNRLFVKIYSSVVNINDGKCSKYLQPTPKQRILAALHDIKKTPDNANSI